MARGRNSSARRIIFCAINPHANKYLAAKTRTSFDIVQKIEQNQKVKTAISLERITGREQKKINLSTLIISE